MIPPSLSPTQGFRSIFGAHGDFLGAYSTLQIPLRASKNYDATEFGGAIDQPPPAPVP